MSKCKGCGATYLTNCMCTLNAEGSSFLEELNKLIIEHGDKDMNEEPYAICPECKKPVRIEVGIVKDNGQAGVSIYHEHCDLRCVACGEKINPTECCRGTKKEGWKHFVCPKDRRP